MAKAIEIKSALWVCMDCLSISEEAFEVVSEMEYDADGYGCGEHYCSECAVEED